MHNLVFILPLFRTQDAQLETVKNLVVKVLVQWQAH
jgi:hypothetical protein